MRPPDTTLATAAEERPARRARRRWMPPAAFLVAVSGALGVGVLSEDAPSTMLGASAAVPGGLARVNGILPYEAAAEPDEAVPAELAGPVRNGNHRVLVLLEVTAMEPGGVEFDVDDYALERLGGGRSRAVWASPRETPVAQGGNLHAELVFEVPDKALELVLEGAGDARLSLGTDHHSGGAGGR